MPAGKLDLFRIHKAEYAATRKPALVRVAKAAYLSIDGRGAPGSDLFTASIGALYGAAFTIKMTRKFAGNQDYAIGKLEAQWFSPRGSAADTEWTNLPRNEWEWRLMIRTPEFIAHSDLDAAVATLRKRGKDGALERLKLNSLVEGDCVQMLHLGPYEREPESIAAMREFAGSKGYSLRGPHHEIYISDPRRVEPPKLKTILRIPVTV